MMTHNGVFHVERNATSLGIGFSRPPGGGDWACPNPAA